MYQVIAATTNPAKIKAIHLAFDAVFGAGSYQLKILMSIAVFHSNLSVIMKPVLGLDSALWL